MDELIKLNNLTSGRDKLARLLQYASRAVWHVLQQYNISRSSVDQFKSLEYTFSTFRKLLRLGRFLDAMHAALNCMTHRDHVIRVTCTMSKIAYALFLLCDHILWVGRVGVMDINVEKWSSSANKYWLVTILLNLIRDYYEFSKVFKSFSFDRMSPDLKTSVKTLYILGHSNKDIMLDSIKNICDVFIPASALGYFKVSPGMVGLLGIISSIAGIISLVDPMAKLSPP